MTLPFALPPWLPWWVPIAVLVVALLYLLAFLMMPFSVIGLKGRLEMIDARLDEIQGEIRNLALRLPEPIRGTAHDEVLLYAEPDAEMTAPTRGEALSPRPPIPPAPERAPRAVSETPPLRAGREAAARTSRAEPRLGR